MRKICYWGWNCKQKMPTHTCKLLSASSCGKKNQKTITLSISLLSHWAHYAPVGCLAIQSQSLKKLWRTVQQCTLFRCQNCNDRRKKKKLWSRIKEWWCTDPTKKTLNLLVTRLPSMAAISFPVLITQKRAHLGKNCRVGHHQVIFVLGKTLDSLDAAIKD